MHFNFNFYSDKLSSTYLSAVKNLHNDVNVASNIGEKIELFNSFTKKYTTIPCIWEEWLRISSQSDPNTLETTTDKISTDEILIKAQFHFFFSFMGQFPDIYDDFENIRVWKKLIERPILMHNGYKPKEHVQILKYANNCAFDIPNLFTKNNWKYYKQYSTAPASQELRFKYKKSMSLFKEFEALKDEIEKWLNHLLIIDDDKFIIQNIEFKLGKYPWNHKIWQFYFEFLSRKNYYEWLLNLYLRYCRFFIEDVEMRKKYRNEVIRIEKLKFNVTKWKTDCIKFERDFNSKQTAIILMNELFDEKNIKIGSLDRVLKSMEEGINNGIMHYPSYAIEEPYTGPHDTNPSTSKILLCQNFAFKKPLIDFVLRNANHKTLSKMYSTCKLFYSLLKIPICYQMEIGDFIATTSYQQSIFVSSHDFKLTNIKQLYLTNSFFVRDFIDPHTISKIIPKIYKSDIKYFSCNSQILTLKEFKFICGNVKDATFLFSSHITDGNRIVSLFEITCFMPFIKKLSFQEQLPLFPPDYKYKNADNAIAVKIKELYIHLLSDLNEPVLAYTFFINIAAPKSHIAFRVVNNDDNKEILKNLLTNHSWHPEDQKPYFRLF